MANHERFHLKTLTDLRQKLGELGLNLPLSENLQVLSEPVQAGDFILPNRFVAQPMEGVDALDATGAPSDYTFRRYKRYASGGSGLIWFEAVVVNPSGRSNPRQLFLNEKTLDSWKRLTDETREAAFKAHGHEILLVIQLTHSGRWSKPEGIPQPIIIHHIPQLDKAAGIDASYPVMTDSEMDFLQDDFVRTARFAAEAGFDGVEMKAVHGYLTGEMLSARSREGKYGGSYENRTRFVREAALRMAGLLPKGRFVTARLTMREPSPYPYGWGVKEEPGSLKGDLAEPLRFAGELTTSCRMPLFNFSLGYPRFKPHMNRPFDNPVKGGAVPPEHPLEGIARFQEISRELQNALGPVPVATAALAWLRHLGPYVMAGLAEKGWASLIGQGRQMFAYPDFPRDLMAEGRVDPKKCCLTCSLCSQIMKGGKGRSGCPVRDKEYYREELKKSLE